MDHLEQENRELRKELTTLREILEILSSMMEALVATHNSPPPPETPLQRTVIFEITRAVKKHTQCQLQLL